VSARPTPTPTPTDLHEWLSFEDPEEDRTWVFDVTFLTSNYHCIFGAGCQGIEADPAADTANGCCTHGAYFTDDDDRARIEAAVARLGPEHWQNHRLGASRGALVTERGGDARTRLHRGACILLNRPGFPGGEGCALHRAALDHGERPLDWKPEVCWQVPVRRVDSTDEVGHVTSTVREWKRRDWGEGGLEFHWWCTEAHEAFTAAGPVYLTMRDELVEMVGAAVYERLVAALAMRGSEHLLAHPTVRRPTAT
jgi:hypothetical protein